MSETAITKCRILVVHTENDVWGDVTDAYNKEMSDLIDYIKNTMTQKFEITGTFLQFNDSDMIQQIIRFWSDENIDTIFIIGYPYFSNKYKNMIVNIYNKYTNKITKKVEKVIPKQIKKRHAYILKEVQAKLEPKFHRSICGILKKTLIINLFGFNKNEAITCLDVIVKIIHGKYIIRLTREKNEEKNEATTSSSYNTYQVEEDKIKDHEESEEEDAKSDDMHEFVSLLPPSTTKGNDMNKKKRRFFLFPGKLMEMMHVASEVTAGAKSFSSETFKTEYPMTAVEDALLKIQQNVKYDIHEPLCDFIRTNYAYGRILADHVYSDYDVPAFRCATKHGYAVLASDGEGRRIIVSRTTSDPVSLIPGTCIYVKSGARVPDEATAVVPIKDVMIINDYADNLILIKIKPEFEQNIKDIGSDIRKGKLIIYPFTRIGPAELGLLAATGRKEVRVLKLVSIGILSIGDLLEEPTEPLRSGYVYDSNRISLIALLKDQGFNSIVDFGIVTDDILPIKMKIKNALKQVVVLVTIGCSNDNDLLKFILKNDFDATIHFGNVFLKPGKSTTFATCMFNDKLKYLVCLPKNPVSASVSAHLFLLPILNKLHHIGMPCKIPARIHDRYILHSRPRAAWATLKWNEEDNFARAFNRENLDSDKPSSSQAANALLLFPQQTMDLKVMYESFVPACPIK
ncbi:gephyrin isoform X2 [Camponotus floridanus]|uniref:gephyrin isoform X2 n=1 Tax=Camponotus floridanus TaxID=104421 RepID=UPI000DC68C67|nr:gephyrin isoform X2 [Camponotus floridanus]